MPKKEKPPKEKKEKKEKREKKDKKKKENERDKRKMVRISLAICGERRTVESVMNLVCDLPLCTLNHLFAL